MQVRDDDILAKAGDAGDGSLSEAEAVHAFLQISRRLSGPLLSSH